MLHHLTPADRLIIAADFKPSFDTGRAGVRSQVLRLADNLNGLGIILKVNSALRACGYGLIDEIHSRGLRVFADLKLNDIPETLSIDGELLREANPLIVTAMCTTGKKGLLALKEALPQTEILGVTVLTSLADADTQAMFTCQVSTAVSRFANVAAQVGLGGLISSPDEAGTLRDQYGLLMSINTPGIRPEWAKVPGDDQNQARVMTPARAIAAGADRIVIGRPVTQANNPREAAERTLAEIAVIPVRRL